MCTLCTPGAHWAHSVEGSAQGTCRGCFLLPIYKPAVPPPAHGSRECSRPVSRPEPDVFSDRIGCMWVPCEHEKRDVPGRPSPERQALLINHFCHLVVSLSRKEKPGWWALWLPRWSAVVGRRGQFAIAFRGSGRKNACRLMLQFTKPAPPPPAHGSCECSRPISRTALTSRSC